MGMIWKFEMVLLSTLAALVILVHSEEDTGSREVQITDETLTVRDPQSLYSNLKTELINTEGPIKRIRRRKRPKATERLHRRHKDGHNHNSHTKKSVLGDVIEPFTITLGPDETVIFSETNTIRAEEANHKKVQNIVIKVPRKSQGRKNVTARTSKKDPPVTIQKQSKKKQVYQATTHKTDSKPTQKPASKSTEKPAHKPAPKGAEKSLRTHKMMTRYDTSNDNTGQVVDDKNPEEIEQTAISDPVSRRIFDQTFRHYGKQAITQVTKSPVQIKYDTITEKPPTPQTPAPATKFHNGNGPYRTTQHIKKENMTKILQTNREQVRIPVNQEDQRSSSNQAEANDYVQSQLRMNPYMNKKKEKMPNRLQTNQEEVRIPINQEESAAADEQLPTYQDEEVDYIQIPFQQPNETEFYPVEVRTTISPEEQRPPPYQEYSKHYGHFQGDNLSEKIYMSPETRAYLRGKMNITYGLNQDSDYEQLANLPYGENGTQTDFIMESYDDGVFSPHSKKIDLDYVDDHFMYSDSNRPYVKEKLTLSVEKIQELMNGVNKDLREDKDQLNLEDPFDANDQYDSKDDENSYFETREQYQQPSRAEPKTNIRDLLTNQDPSYYEEQGNSDSDKVYAKAGKPYPTSKTKTSERPHKSLRTSSTEKPYSVQLRNTDEKTQSKRIKEYLKQANITSLSEILQKYNMTLDDLLQGRKVSGPSDYSVKRSNSEEEKDIKIYNGHVMENLRINSQTSENKYPIINTTEVQDINQAKFEHDFPVTYDNNNKHNNSGILEDTEIKNKLETNNMRTYDEIQETNFKALTKPNNKTSIPTIENNDTLENLDDISFVSHSNSTVATYTDNPIHLTLFNLSIVDNLSSEQRNQTSGKIRTKKRNLRPLVGRRQRMKILMNRNIPNKALLSMSTHNPNHLNMTLSSDDSKKQETDIPTTTVVNTETTTNINFEDNKTTTISSTTRVEDKKLEKVEIINTDTELKPKFRFLMPNRLGLKPVGRKSRMQNETKITDVSFPTKIQERTYDPEEPVMKSQKNHTISSTERISKTNIQIILDENRREITNMPLPTKKLEKSNNREAPVTTTQRNHIISSTEAIYKKEIKEVLNNIATKKTYVPLPTKQQTRTYHREEPVMTTQKNHEMSSTEGISKIEIQEILNDTSTIAKLSDILLERNMTLYELLLHRERGSSNVHLADIFHNASREPNPEPEPFLSKSVIEPISKETYPLRAILEANQHEPVTKISSTENSRISQYVPVVMDFKNNVNENAENVGLISIFNRIGGKSTFQNSTIQTDSKGTPYVSSVISVNASEKDEDNLRNKQTTKYEINNTTRRHFNGGEKFLRSVKEIQDKENIYSTQKIGDFMDSKSLLMRDVAPIIDVNASGPRDDIHRKIRMDIENNNAGSQFVGWNNIVEMMNENRDIDNSNPKTDIIEDSASRSKYQIHSRETSSASNKFENELVDLEFPIFRTQSYSKSIPIATASIFGFVALLFLTVYAVFKIKYRRQSLKSLEKNEICTDDFITPRVFNRQRSISDSNSANAIPFITSNNIYSLSSSNYEWEDLRGQSKEGKVSEIHSSAVGL